MIKCNDPFCPNLKFSSVQLGQHTRTILFSLPSAVFSHWYKIKSITHQIEWKTPGTMASTSWSRLHLVQVLIPRRWRAVPRLKMVHAIVPVSSRFGLYRYLCSHQMASKRKLKKKIQFLCNFWKFCTHLCENIFFTRLKCQKIGNLIKSGNAKVMRVQEKNLFPAKCGFLDSMGVTARCFWRIYLS